MNLFKKKLRVVTHDGSFHADEVFACATLGLWAEQNNLKLDIIRSRDPEIIKKGEIVVDVGMEYDPARGRFDHHQKGGSGEHKNGIPYASFGLVWKHYGEQVCGGDGRVVEMIEGKLVVPIDAMDNGVNTTKTLLEGVPEYRINKELVYAFRPDFEAFLSFATDLIKREIKRCTETIVGEKKVKAEIERQNEPEILILEEEWAWKEVAAKTKLIKAVIYPEPEQDAWCGETVRSDLGDYGSARFYFPESWRGLRGEELEEACGVAGALFCHRAGFFAVNKTKEGAIKMAEFALQKSQN